VDLFVYSTKGIEGFCFFNNKEHPAFIYIVETCLKKKLTNQEDKSDYRLKSRKSQKPIKKPGREKHTRTRERLLLAREAFAALLVSSDS
jgi:hypothetical protein